MRAIKNQHRQRASLVSTDGAKVWESFVPDEFLRVGGKLEKVLGKEVHFFLTSSLRTPRNINLTIFLGKNAKNRAFLV